MTDHLDEPGEMIFRSDYDKDGKVLAIYMTEPPPRIVLIDQIMLTKAKDIFQVSGTGYLDITTKNAKARYKLANVQLQENAITFERVSSSFALPPESPAEKKLKAS